MAGFDFSQISDEQLEATVTALMRDPFALRTTPVAQRQATIDEYNRRKAARSAPAQPAAPPNVEANLEASATPIAPDPVVGQPRPAVPFRLASDEAIMRGHFGPGGIPTEDPENIPVREDELDEYGARFRGAIGNRIDRGVAARQAARAAGYEDPEQIAYNEATGVVYDRPAPGPMQGPSQMDPNDPSTWDAGYDDYVQRNTPAAPTNSVERVDRYFADKNRAPLQSKEDFMADQSQAYTRRQAAKNQEQYGYGLPADQVSDDQRKRRADLAASEAKMAGSDRRVDAMLARMAERAGVSTEEARKAWDAAVAASDGKIKVEDGLTPDEIFMGTQSLRDKAKTRQAAGRQTQRDKIALRREVRYNPVAALGDESGLNDWQRMVVADGMLRGGNRGPTPLGVQAMDMQNAANVIQRFLTGGAAGMMNNPVAAAAAQQQQVQQQQDAVKWAEDNVNKNYAWDATTWFGSEFTNEEYQKAIDDLMVRFGPPAGKMTLAEATRIVDSIAAKKRRPGAGRLPPPDGDGNPGRVPEGHG